MFRHFDRYLNLKELILNEKPSVVMECGAGNGELTRALSGLKALHSFDLHVITDKALSDIPGVTWRIGVSYKELSKLPEDSIDLCIIDTDHNYWTLMRELMVLDSRMKEGGVMAFHDVMSFYYDTGMAMSYWDGEPYPEESIRANVGKGGVGCGLIDFLSAYRHRYQLERWVPDSCGAALIRRKNAAYANIVTPAKGSPFAQV